MSALDAELAGRFMTLTLSHLGRRYPYKLDLVLTGPKDAVEPHLLHPVFHGSFDWHSCVHGWWQVLRLARLFPDLPEAQEARELADTMLVPEKVAGELAFLARPSATTFERPYGWAWLLALHSEAAQHDAPWAAALAPLARAFAARFNAFLPKLTYPIRVGTHYSTAFALTLARHWALRFDPPLAALIDSRARDWFLADRACQAWEPGGDEFLSPALGEAALMREVLPSEDFADWFAAFLPEAALEQPATLFTPVEVSDRSDGKIVHLDGLNLSRAWAWRRIASAVPDPLRTVALAAARRHRDAGLPHVSGDYMGEHWLASFALLALADLDGAAW